MTIEFSKHGSINSSNFEKILLPLFKQFLGRHGIFAAPRAIAKLWP